MFGAIFYKIKIVALALAAAIGIGASAPAQFGASIPVVVTSFETSLATGITSSDTSMTLVKGTDDAGTSLSGYMCFTLDVNTTSQEIVCGTVSATAVTSMLRGIDPQDGDLEVSALKFSHRRGATVKITDAPSLQIISRILNGTETFPNAVSYAAGVASSTLTGQNLASVNYVNGVAFAGAPNGSLTVKGIFEEATKAQTAAGTATDGTGADLIAPNAYFNATQSATTTVPVTGVLGKLSQAFLDLTENFTFTGGLRSSSSTISGTLALSATSTVTGNTTFSTTPTITNVPTTGTQATNKTYVDGLTSIYSASTGGRQTVTASTSTLMLTLAHPASSTIMIICDVVDTTNNSQPTLTLRAPDNATAVDSCTVGTGTGNPAGCTLLGIIAPGAATSSQVYINDSNAGNESGSCIAHTL